MWRNRPAVGTAPAPQHELAARWRILPLRVRGGEGAKGSACVQAQDLSQPDHLFELRQSHSSITGAKSRQACYPGISFRRRHGAAHAPKSYPGITFAKAASGLVRRAALAQRMARERIRKTAQFLRQCLRFDMAAGRSIRSLRQNSPPPTCAGVVATALLAGARRLAPTSLACRTRRQRVGDVAGAAQSSLLASRSVAQSFQSGG